MDLELEGRRAVVVGGSRGVGRAVAQGLAAEGCAVVVGSRGVAELEQAAAEISAAAGRAVVPLPVDLAAGPSVEAFAGGALDHLGGVDIVVDSAAAPPYGRRDALDSAAWADAYAQVFDGARRLTEALLPGMRARRWGRIVYVLSSTVRQPGMMPLNAQHAALAAYAKGLANEVGAANVLVNSVCPTFVDTGRLAALVERRAEELGESPETVRRRWMRSVPLGRPATPREVADLVVFLASERASYLTGRAFDVDGGLLGSTV